MKPRRNLPAVLLLAGLTVTPALAQGVPGFGGGGRHGGGRRHGAPPAASPDAPAPKPEPTQRLDPGALLCRTEDALRQHQAAVLARLGGRDADEPAGCHLVPAMTPVTVVARHGPASTEVRLPGPLEGVGWTDAAVRDGPTGAR